MKSNSIDLSGSFFIYGYLSSGCLRRILCLIGTTTVQMFSKQKAPTLY